MPVTPYKSSYDKTKSDIESIEKKRKDAAAKINKVDAEDAALIAEIANLKKIPNSSAELAKKEAEHAEKIKQKRELNAVLNNLEKQEQQIRQNSNEDNSTQLQTKNANNFTNTNDPFNTTKLLDTSTGFNPLDGTKESTPINITPGTSPLQSNVEDAELNKIRGELKKEGQLSCDNADIGGFANENTGAVGENGEIVIINENDHSLFAGLKMESVEYEAKDGSKVNLNSYTAERIKYYQSTDKTKGFIVPWDGRLGMAYTSTESIGNYMPYGEEWVGSPSIMNPYALIRYEHIASRRHHHYLIDQRNTKGGFRGTKFKPYANLKDYSSKQIKTGKNGQTEVQMSDAEKRNLGVYPGDAGNGGEPILADDTGALYIEETDYSQQVWKPTKAIKQIIGEQTKVYEITDNPSSIVVNTPEYGKAQEIARLNKIRSGSGKAKIEGAKAPTENMDKADTPDKPGFWLLRQGWEKCQGLYVTAGVCQDGKITGIAEGDLANVEKSSKEIKSFIDVQTSRQWKAQGYNTSRKYLRKPNTLTQIREPLDPSYNNLCDSENWAGQEQFQYRWVDFLYNSHYGLIPNNFLVTLRRYPVPINDAGTVPDQDKTKQHLLPMAQAITYLGDATGNLISDLMSFSAKMNWKEIEAQINEIQGNEQGAESSPMGQGFGKWLGILSGQSDFSRVSGWDEQRAKFDPYNDGMYANRIFGPVNVVTKTKARERGLEFDHSINLNFHYTLRSIGGVNPKAAMLDIMSNILALTYNNANFWGGANRYFPNKPAYPFLGGKKGMQSWYSGNVTGFMDGIADQLMSAMGNLGSMFQSILTNPKEALKNIGGKAAGVWMADKQREKRPAILGFKALLTGDPVGEWHLVVGNPFNPMMMIGNLICTGVKFGFSDQLEADDFPNEMIVTIQLEHGRPRDKGDIESMFNRGGGRLHYSYFGKDTEVWNNASSTRDSKTDESWNGSGQTTIIDNFSGKTMKVKAFTPDSNTHTSAGGSIGVSQPFPSSIGMAKMYTSTTKLANELSYKVGFKSGS